MTLRTLIAASLALTAALATGAAQARDHADVQWSVTIGAPVYAQPYPVYRAPYPVYRESYPAYVRPAPVYREASRWDRDGDGIPNRYDRVYNPRWDRDGDGIPNRYDRHDRSRHDRDGDGIPNWRDHRNGRGG